MDFLKQLDTRKNSDDIAYIHKDQQISYKELLHKANCLAHYLQRTLKEEKTPIPVYGHKDAMMLVCFLACVKSGRAYCPIDSHLPLTRVEAILDSVKSQVVLCCEELPLNNDTLLRKSEIQTILDCEEEIEDTYYVKEEDLYYIIFTSGSSGTPKGVQITYGNLNHFLEFSIPLAKVETTKKVFINQAPFSFDLSVMDVYSALGSGSCIFALDQELMSDYRALFQALQNSEANVWVSTPSFADICLIDPYFSYELMPKLDTFLFCGEILNNETVRKLRNAFPTARIINTYGPTESTVAVTSIEIDETLQQLHPLPIGVAKENTIIQIIDEEGNCLPQNEIGEILILGDTVGSGYYQDQENTQKAFDVKKINDVQYPAYHTGDKGYLQGDMLYYCGRMDLQVKVHGYRIEIADIEQNLMKLKSVEKAVVVPHYKADKIKKLVAFVVANGEIENQFQFGRSLSTQLKNFIPEYMIPRKYIFVKELPVNNNGKVDRKALQGELT